MRDDALMRHRRAILGSLGFLLVGPVLEMGVGPYLLSDGFSRGDGALDGALAVVAGIALIALGALVVAACFMRFVADGSGTPSPLAPPVELVARGPYRYVRNPMYVATAAVIAGEGLLLARPVLVVAAAVYVAAMALLAYRVEEPLLARRFGVAWERYRLAVPGWVPRLTPWRGDGS